MWGGESIGGSAENPALLDSFDGAAGAGVEFAGHLVAEFEGLPEEDFLAGVGADVATGLAAEADGEDGDLVDVEVLGGPDDEAVLGVLPSREDGALDGDFVFEQGVPEHFEDVADGIAGDATVGAEYFAVVGVELEDRGEGLVGAGVVRDTVGEVVEGAGPFLGDVDGDGAEGPGLDGEFPASGDGVGLGGGVEDGCREYPDEKGECREDGEPEGRDGGLMRHVGGFRLHAVWIGVGGVVYGSARPPQPIRRGAGFRCRRTELAVRSKHRAVEVSVGTRVVRVDRGMRVEAASRLVAHAMPGEREPGRRLIAAAAANQINLEQMWASVDGETGRIGQVCVVVPGNGGTGVCFASTPRSDEEVSELGGVVDAACRGAEGVRLAQILLEPHEERLARAFEQGGFLRLAVLDSMRRAAPSEREVASWGPAPGWGEGVEVRSWRVGDDETVGRAIERSYEETLDCPALCGLRSMEDVIASHRGTGVWESGLWFIVFLEGSPEGVMLLNPSPGIGSVELIYLGLSKRLRGRGLGERLLRYGLAKLVGRAEQRVQCAVDRGNAPALRLYERLGFRVFESRLAMVRKV